MARYDLYAFNGGIVVDLQADLIVIPGSRVVAPVLPEARVPDMIQSLHPRVMIDGIPHLVATHLLAAAPQAMLKTNVGDVAAHADEITRALDLLFQGH